MSPFVVPGSGGGVGSRVEIAMQGWGWVFDQHGNGLANKEVQIKNLDDTPATHWDALVGGTGSTTVLTTNIDGSIPGYIEAGSYDAVINGVTHRVEAYSGLSEARLTSVEGRSMPVDVDQTTPSDGQVATYVSSFGQVKFSTPTAGGATTFSGATAVASAYATTAEKDMADFVCDGTADEAQINSAINQLAALTPSQGVPGGGVELIGPRFNISTPILLKSYITLFGVNRFFNDVRAASGFTGTEMIKLANVDVEFTTVRDLKIHGGYQGAIGSISGIAYDNTAGSFSFADASHTIKDLYIHGCKNHGLWLKQDNRDTTVWNVRVVDAGMNGFLIESPDCNFVQCTSGSAGNEGWYVSASNGRFSTCKSWYSGSTNGSNGSGWYIHDPRNEFSSCEAQDNAMHGFYIATGRQTLSACYADSNSYWSANIALNQNLYDGFHINTSAGFVDLHGFAGDKNEGARGYCQRNGVRCNAAVRDSVIDISGEGNVSALVGGTLTGAGLFVRGSGLRSDGTTRDTVLIHNGQAATIP